MNDFENEDTFDTRDVLDRIQEINRELIPLEEHERDRLDALRLRDALADDKAIVNELEELEARLGLEAERNELEALLDEIGGEAEYGVTLIAEDYFTTYAQELADDLYDIRDAKWPFNHIDWEAAADDLHHDYSCIEFRGYTFYYRG